MGAHNIADHGTGRTMGEAYRDAVESSEYMHGHDSYNGTISTTGGFRDMSRKLGARQTDAAIERWFDDAWNNTDKWGKVWGAELSLAQSKKREPTLKRGHRVYIFAGWGAS